MNVTGNGFVSPKRPLSPFSELFPKAMLSGNNVLAMDDCDSLDEG